MKFYLSYQHLPRGGQRPVDQGEVFNIDNEDAARVNAIPNVGDYVQIQLSGGQSFDGKVKSRLFRYLETYEEPICAINIVVEDTDDNWGLLVKE